MSSSNRVQLSYIEETTYNETPATGDFTQVKFTAETLTGTPQTVESQEIRSDRQTSGQVNTGLELSGGFEFELSGDPSIQYFVRHAMMDNLGTAETAPIADLTIDTTAGTITTTNDFVAGGIANGDMVILSGFTNATNNTVVMVSNVTTTVLDYVGDGTEVDEAAVGAQMIRPLYYEIGIDLLSSSISKEFLDIDTPNIRSIAYTGERVGEMSMNFAFGEIVTGSFSLAGAGYSLPTVPITDGRTLNPAGDDQPLDASNSFGWLLVNGQDADICLESLAFTLNNNLLAQNCIGLLAPQDQIPGSAAVTFESSMHLGPNSFDLFMPAKLTQTGASLSFYTRDVNNKGYGVTMWRVQFNFPDPAAGGRDQQVLADVSGTASYDSTQQNTMRIYILK